MATGPRWRVRAVLLVILLGVCGWLFCVVAPETPGVGKSVAVSTDAQSAIVLDGVRFSVASLCWKGPLLELVFRVEVMEDVDARPWRPLEVLRCQFWDSQHLPAGEDVEVLVRHDRAFRFGEVDCDSRTFTIRVPDGASFLAALHESASLRTNKVKIPRKPLLDLLR